MLLLLTGARRNEITHAKWENLDPEKRTLLVPLSKSGKPRLIALNSAAMDILQSMPRNADSPYIFPAPTTGRPSPSLHFPWTRIRVRAGLPDLRLHDLRHSFASFLVNKGVSLYVVQGLLGHTQSLYPTVRASCVRDPVRCCRKSRRCPIEASLGRSTEQPDLRSSYGTAPRQRSHALFCNCIHCIPLRQHFRLNLRLCH